MKPMTIAEAKIKACDIFKEGLVHIYYDYFRNGSGTIEHKFGVYSGEQIKHFTAGTFEEVFVKINEYLEIKKETSEEDIKHITSDI